MNLNRAQMPDLGTNWRISKGQTFDHTSSPAHWLWVDDNDLQLRAVPGLQILAAPTWDAMRLAANDWLMANSTALATLSPDEWAIKLTGSTVPMGNLLNAVVQRHIELTKAEPAISRDDQLELALRRLIIRAKKEGGGAWSQVTGAVTLLGELT